MSGAFDAASKLEQRERDTAIAAHRNRHIEKPDQDDDGNRFCLDCADQIPGQRIESVNAVRCVDCQGVREQKNRTGR